MPVFARYGYKRTRIEDVSAELYMVSGTLYRYVKEQFVRLCQNSYQYLSQDRDMRKILMDDPSIFPLSPRKVRFPGIDNYSLDMIKALLRKGMDQGIFRKIDVESTAEFLYSIYVMFIIKTYVKSEGNSSSTMYEQGIELILNGLLARPEKP